MRTGTAISVVVHVTFVALGLLFSGVRLFNPTAAEAITVDLVTPDQVPEPAKKPEPEKPDFDFPTLEKPQPKPAPAAPPAASSPPKPAAAAQQQTLKPAPQQQAAVSPQPNPPKPVEQAVPQAAPVLPYGDVTQKFSKLVGADPNDFDSAATTAANISTDSARSLRDHLRTCSVLPATVASNDTVKIVLRVWLLPDGKLAKEPLLIQASASEKGPLLMKSAINALLACQPYAELPPDKYNEWKMLDLTFTPKDFKG